jgi:hypothetical protein
VKGYFQRGVVAPYGGQQEAVLNFTVLRERYDCRKDDEYARGWVGGEETVLQVGFHRVEAFSWKRQG